MKKMRILTILILTLGLISCNKDKNFEEVYSFTTETYTDITKLNNNDDATKMENIFFENKWFTTKKFSGNTVEESDSKAKSYFYQIVEQANTSFVEIKLNGNCKFTYKCTRNNTNTNAKMEIAKQEWKYLKTE